MNKKNLFGKTLSELKEIMSELSLPSFVAKQIANWLYQKRVSSLNEMLNISKKNREVIARQYTIEKISPQTFSKSKDGTKKYLFPVHGDGFIEVAYIPERHRATLCVSSQIGCKMNCDFCMTGKQGFQKHLSSGEILSQIYEIPEIESLTNIVYMGMGEPFDNTEEVLKSLEILTSEWGFGMSAKRITVSSIGIIPGLKRFMNESKCHLAISLHSPFHEERLSLMPIENKYPVLEVIKTIRDSNFPKHRKISFEYIMFKGFNDSSKHAKAIVQLLNGMNAKVNLIRFHSIPGSHLQASCDKTMENFRDMLNKKGIVATIRASRGQDIEAACGMLSTLALLKKP
jgi:23S rRNA (adenine2503-C2)-methyltransferase